MPGTIYLAVDAVDDGMVQDPGRWGVDCGGCISGGLSEDEENDQSPITDIC